MEIGATNEDYDRVCLLVGRYMHHFALLESGIDTAVGKLLSIDTLQNQIVVRNIEFSRKIYILKSAVSLKTKQVEKVALLNKVMKAAEIRNVVAHNVFGPDRGGIRFLTVAARSELKFPETFYTLEGFSELTDELVWLRAMIDKMTAEMTKPTTNILQEIMRNALTPPV